MVYLIHINEKIAHASHYVGYAVDDVQERFKRHQAGNGARLLRAAKKRGIDFQLVRVWENAEKDFERKAKRYKKSRLLCPVCSGEVAFRHLPSA